MLGSSDEGEADAGSQFLFAFLTKLTTLPFTILAVWIGAFQDFLILAGKSFANLLRRPHYWSDVFIQMDVIGVGSLPIVILTGFFSGAIIALQMARALNMYGASSEVGSIVSLTLVRELGPVLTALMVAGRNASGIASELGSMKVTEQIDAMRALGTDPLQKLVTPRLIAGAVMIPGFDRYCRRNRLVWRLCRGCSAAQNYYWRRVLDHIVAGISDERSSPRLVEASYFRHHRCISWMFLRTANHWRNPGCRTRNHGSGCLGLHVDLFCYVSDRQNLCQPVRRCMADEPLLNLENVSLRYGGKWALKNVSLKLTAGETRIIFGEAGSGKTSLLKAVVGLIEVDEGRVELFGKDVRSLKEKDLFALRSCAGFLFQEGGLFDSMTVGENVEYPLVNRVVSNGHAQTGENPEEKVREALRFVELDQTIDKFPAELSGGMRRRVGIARATVTEPPLVLYDSPTAGLDPITANTIMSLVAKERDVRNSAALIVTHRYQDGEIMADFQYDAEQQELIGMDTCKDERKRRRTKFIVMKNGEIVFFGTRDELEKSSDAYVKRFVRHEE